MTVCVVMKYCCQLLQLLQLAILLHTMYFVNRFPGIIIIIIIFFQPVELVTTCTLTMLGALEVVRAAYCAL